MIVSEVMLFQMLITPKHFFVINSVGNGQSFPT